MGPGGTCPWSSRLSGFRVRTWIEPVVASTQVAGSLYDAGLLLVVKESFKSEAGGSSNYSANQSLVEYQEDQQQKAISNFNIIYNLVLGLTPLLSAYGLGWLSDRYHRKISICTAMLGFLLSRIGLLLKVMLDWPVEVMYGAAALNGLCGSFSAYWSGVMALGSLGCSEGRRSVRLILIDLVLGLAGFSGSMASGHLFKQIVGHSAQGLLLTACSVGCAAFALFYSLFVLKVPESKPNKVHPTVDTVSGMMGTYRTLDPDQQDKQNVPRNPRTPGKGKSSQREVVALLFVGAIIYDLAAVGTVDVMALFVLKEPLHWNQVQLGYGMASGYIIFITSFLGVLVFSRCFRDTTMIIIGMLSFGSGALLLAFVKETYMFYIARAIMLFALIPITTIRSAMSKLIKDSSYGKIFVILQLCLTLTGVVTSTIYNKIYQLTLDKFIGTCFVLSSFLSFLAIVPIGVVAYKQVPRSQQGECAEKQRS
ncbi:solute carrier family 46 member 2 [Mus musculus]|uniref:Solute carrier family 46 member 2 n=1 Tax=Mus musculus TaxID=10090 RepID=S46A2_MOUSE|nr:solute carrier family 46 member 2 [Mus musculus]Q8CA03.2 RecName: Full=Solute carrier family 46 member 2; AltName: Full=Thymic stromal cotransporter homolog [Mus musculus]|eukprot:NP_066395.3 thymic stromal cotransporter protein [Mus musculus]